MLNLDAADHQSCELAIPHSELRVEYFPKSTNENCIYTTRILVYVLATGRVTI
jgi:hypothetical protein